MIFLKYLFIFCTFSFIGWVLEFMYRSLYNKKIINPGFMNGCVVPLYGIGAVILNLLCYLMEPIKTEFKQIYIFIISIIVLSLLEFFTGYILLKIFKIKLWDYSKNKFNFKGFICIEFSILWGFLSLFFYNFIFLNINRISLLFINNNICLFFLGIFVGIFLIDLFMTIDLLSKLREYSKTIRKIINVDSLKINIFKQLKTPKLLNIVFPYIDTKKYLKEKIDNKDSKKNEI